MSRRTSGTLTDRETLFIEAMGRGLSKVAAAREAGYADPNGEVDRLLARPEVRNAALLELAKHSLTVKHLVQKGLMVSARAMDEYLAGDLEARRDAIYAAKTVLDAVKKTGVPLFAAAEAEDQAINHIVAAKAILEGRALPLLPAKVGADGSEPEH